MAESRGRDSRNRDVEVNTSIFVSYRRDDSAGYAARLYDRLKDHFGAGCVFRDIDSIVPGVPWEMAIDEAIDGCSVMVVVIGPRWLTVADAEGKRRLDNREDRHRLEIEHGLRRLPDLRLFPVLVEGARMPGKPDLPDSLNLLPGINALPIFDQSFDYSVNQLIELIEKVIGGIDSGGGGQEDEEGRGQDGEGEGEEQLEDVEQPLLSMSAQRLLADLRRTITSEPRAWDWVVALLRDERDAAAEAASDVDLDELERSAQEMEDRGALLDTTEVARRAGVIAAAEDRPVVLRGDVAAAVLESV